MSSLRAGRLAGLLIVIPVALAVASPSSAASTSDRPERVIQSFRDAGGTYHCAFDPARRPGASVRTVVGVMGPEGGCSIILSGSGSAGGGARQS